MRALIDLTGKKFAKLTVLKRDNIKNKRTHWLCICECGNKISVEAHNLKSGHTKSCGCSRLESKELNLTGRKFGRLTVIRKDDSRKYYWTCICSCDKNAEISVSSKNLKSGHTKSCGCLQIEIASNVNTKHGMCKTSEYKAWAKMLSRCNNPKDKSYYNYGGRGIKVCDEWNDSFDKFYEDMGNKPSKNHQIDRINNDIGYSKENCRWSTSHHNSMNRRGLGYKTSKYKGVSWNKDKNKWVAQIQLNHKTYYLGCFTDEVEAAKMYDKKATELFMGYAYLNFKNKDKDV